MSTTFEQQIAANFVHMLLQKNPLPNHAARITRLKGLMKGRIHVTSDDGETRLYAVHFDGVRPITELLDPAWVSPVNEVGMIPEVSDDDPALVSEAA